MIAKSYSSLAAFMLCCGLLAVADGARCANNSATNSAQSEIATINPHRLAKVVPGISKAQVKSLLGTPWRTVQYNDEENLEDEIWEYRGRDAAGDYRIHIEFDHHDVVRIVQKVPENT